MKRARPPSSKPPRPRGPGGRFRARWARPSRIQSLEFPRARYSPGTALSWATGHGFQARKVDVRPTTIRLRQEPPGRFARYGRKVLGSGVSAIVGEPKGQKKGR